MPRRRRSLSSRDIERLTRRLLDLLKRVGPTRLPRFAVPILAALVIALAAGGLAWLVASQWSRSRVTPGSVAPRPEEGYLFVEWNVENFFDDHDDPTNHDDVEDWFASEPEMFGRKVDALAAALLLHNDGRGPDIVALVEVESTRCVEALRDRLNAILPAGFQYTGTVHREDKTGRRFGPAILTRLAVREDRTRGARDFDNRRILEVHLEAEGVPLVVLASHWTSRIRGEEASAGKRIAYAEILYARYLALRRRHPGIDVILAGDFNDEPSDPSVREFLHATSSASLVYPGDPDAPTKMLDLVTIPRLRGQGTYYMSGRREFLDHILAPPELLDNVGWAVRPETIAVADFPALRKTPSGPPWKFGSAKQVGARGFSDHFALSVRLRLATLALAAPAS